MIHLRRWSKLSKKGRKPNNLIKKDIMMHLKRFKKKSVTIKVGTFSNKC